MLLVFFHSILQCVLEIGNHKYKDFHHNRSMGNYSNNSCLAILWLIHRDFFRNHNSVWDHNSNQSFHFRNQNIDNRAKNNNSQINFKNYATKVCNIAFSFIHFLNLYIHKNNKEWYSKLPMIFRQTRMLNCFHFRP